MGLTCKSRAARSGAISPGPSLPKGSPVPAGDVRSVGTRARRDRGA